MPPDALTLTDLTVRHGDVLAVDGLDLRIGRGETVALLGPNGAGKSTTVSAVLGLLRRGEGRRWRDRHRRDRARRARRAVGAGRAVPLRLRAVAHGLPSYWYAETGRAAAQGVLPPAPAVVALVGFAAAFGALAVPVARRRPLTAVAG